MVCLYFCIGWLFLLMVCLYFCYLLLLHCYCILFFVLSLDKTLCFICISVNMIRVWWRTCSQTSFCELDMLTVTDPNKQVLPLDCQNTNLSKHKFIITIENPAALEHHQHDSWVACGIWIVTHGKKTRHEPYHRGYMHRFLLHRHSHRCMNGETTRCSLDEGNGINSDPMI